MVFALAYLLLVWPAAVNLSLNHLCASFPPVFVSKQHV